MIVIPNQGRSAKGLVYDMAAPQQAAARLHQVGSIQKPGDVRIVRRHHRRHGVAGVAELQRFVEQGGVLITLGTASAFPAEFGITRRSKPDARQQQFYAPGPIVQRKFCSPRIRSSTATPTREIPVRFANGPSLRFQRGPLRDLMHIPAATPMS